jgi:hypothetical protein
MGRRIALCLVLTRRHMHGFLEDRQHMASEAFYRDNPQAEASFLAIAARMIRNMNAYQKRPDAPLWKEAEESATA